ncbi:MAG TPA: LON peptidase substrate-binding domain-containing protein, partial [Gemmatimonadaceae bacterium]
MTTHTPDGERLPIGDRLPVLPLRDVVFFPYVVMPLLVGRRASLAAVQAATTGPGDHYMLAVTQRDGDA